MIRGYDSWKTRSPDDEHQGEQCECGLEMRRSYGTYCCDRCEHEEAEQERYEYEMQARVEAHSNEAQS